MFKLSLVVSEENFASFPEGDGGLALSAKVEYNSATLNPQKCSVEELLFSLRHSLLELKKSQNQVNFLAEELTVVMKKSNF